MSFINDLSFFCHRSFVKFIFRHSLVYAIVNGLILFQISVVSCQLSRLFYIYWSDIWQPYQNHVLVLEDWQWFYRFRTWMLKVMPFKKQLYSFFSILMPFISFTLPIILAKIYFLIFFLTWVLFKSILMCFKILVGVLRIFLLLISNLIPLRPETCD